MAESEASKTSKVLVATFEPWTQAVWKLLTSQKTSAQRRAILSRLLRIEASERSRPAEASADPFPSYLRARIRELLLLKFGPPDRLAAVAEAQGRSMREHLKKTGDEARRPQEERTRSATTGDEATRPRQERTPSEKTGDEATRPRQERTPIEKTGDEARRPQRERTPIKKIVLGAAVGASALLAAHLYRQRQRHRQRRGREPRITS